MVSAVGSHGYWKLDIGLLIWNLDIIIYEAVIQ